jgi:hypothetical protein
MEEFIKSIFLDYWSWFAVAAILMIVGQFLSKSVFTRERAYADRGEGVRAYIVQSFFWWGRESLMLQPIALGMFIGLRWTDPTGTEWPIQAAMAYFGSAGVAANFGWMIIKARAKAKGVNLKLPGRDTEPPKTP